MTNDEADALSAELSQVLRRAGMEWVLEQVRGEIAVGALLGAEEEEPYEDDNSLPFLVAAPRGLSAAGAVDRKIDIKVEPLSPKDQLRVLVDAARQALVVPHQIGRALPELLGSGVASVAFTDGPDAEGLTLDLADLPTLGASMEIASELENALDQLEEATRS